MISSGAYACIERDTRIAYGTISPTPRGAMVAWLERYARLPVPSWADDESIEDMFRAASDNRGGFAKIAFVTVTHDPNGEKQTDVQELDKNDVRRANRALPKRMGGSDWKVG